MPMRTVSIEYPDEILASLDEEEVSRLAREALFVKLYEQDVLSSARAASLLGMTRWEFLDLLGRYGVSYLDAEGDLTEELRRAQP